AASPEKVGQWARRLKGSGLPGRLGIPPPRRLKRPMPVGDDLHLWSFPHSVIHRVTLAEEGLKGNSGSMPASFSSKVGLGLQNPASNRPPVRPQLESATLRRRPKAGFGKPRPTLNRLDLPQRVCA